MSDNLTDRALEGFHNSGGEAAFLLRDGGRITGKVVDFDGYIVIVSGAPDRLVYRHSILKLVPARAAQKVEAQRPETQKRRAEAPKPRRAPRRETPSAPRAASSEPGFTNPMADAMQKWLKSQKGGG